VISGDALGLVLMRSVSMISFLWIKWLVKNFATAWPLLMKAASLYRSGFNTFEFPLYPIHHVALRDFASEGSVGAFGALDTRSHLKAKLKFARQSQAWERGRHRFEYAILPDVADAGEMVRRGYEFNNPLIVRTLSCTGTDATAAVMDTETDGVIVTAVYPYRDGLVFRCYEHAGKGGTVRFSIAIPVTKVYYMETLGGCLTEISISGNSFAYELAAHEIVNFYLER
jgi:hypothetical protein